MTELEPITVECHAGYKADEYPVCFYWYEKKYEITAITDRWYQAEHRNSYPTADYFKIITSGKDQFIIKHDVERDEWFLVI